MKFSFKVYYRDGTEENSWAITKKFKLVSAKNKKEAVEKFVKRYPHFIPTYVC